MAATTWWRPTSAYRLAQPASSTCRRNTARRTTRFAPCNAPTRPSCSRRVSRKWRICASTASPPTSRRSGDSRASTTPPSSSSTPPTTSRAARRPTRSAITRRAPWKGASSSATPPAATTGASTTGQESIPRTATRWWWTPTVPPATPSPAKRCQRRWCPCALATCPATRAATARRAFPSPPAVVCCPIRRCWKRSGGTPTVSRSWSCFPAASCPVSAATARTGRWWWGCAAIWTSAAALASTSATPTATTKSTTSSRTP